MIASSYFDALWKRIENEAHDIKFNAAAQRVVYSKPPATISDADTGYVSPKEETHELFQMVTVLVPCSRASLQGNVKWDHAVHIRC